MWGLLDLFNTDKSKEEKNQNTITELARTKDKVWGSEQSDLWTPGNRTREQNNPTSNDEKLALGKGPVRDSYAKQISSQPTASSPFALVNAMNQSKNTSNDSGPNQNVKTNNGAFTFNPNADVNNLGALDVATELPKLNESQISDIISKYFSNSTVITPADAKGIYEAQMESNMSALALLAIAAHESAFGTSEIAKNKNNLWGWNATNSNPGGDATTFSPVAQGAKEYASNYMNQYYDIYGAKSTNSAGTGDNPAGAGYAYYDDEKTIDPRWATYVNNYMRDFYNTAKETYSNELKTAQESMILPGGYQEREREREQNGRWSY